MREFILKDFENGEVIYRGSSMAALKKAAREYDYETEGDWIPLCKSRNTPDEKFQYIDFKY